MVMNDMTETFKPGDRVRCISGYWKGVCGTVTSITDQFTRFRCDEGSVYVDGTPVNKGYLTGEAGMYHHELEKIVQVPNDMTDDGKAVLQPIDWQAPIEAVHDDGRVVAVQLTTWEDERGQHSGPDKQGDYYTTWPAGNKWDVGIWRPNGSSWAEAKIGWRIRNVQPATQTTPNLGATLTAQEHLARMEALVRKMAALNPVTEVAMMHTQEFAEARALVAEMEPEVDGDLAIAREMCAQYAVDVYCDSGLAGEYRDGDCDDQMEMKMTMIGLKRGRELARGDVA